MTYKKWFGYAVLAVLGWGAWALVSKLASDQLPARAVLQLYVWGALLVVVLLLLAHRFSFQFYPKGVLCAVGNGFLGNIGNLAFVAAFQSGGNTSVITVVTSLYPAITVLLALIILRERLTRSQVAGAALALASIVIFSLEE